MNKQLASTDFADMMYATRHYEMLWHTFAQQGGPKEQREAMLEIYNEVITKLKFEAWNDVNLHYIKQIWSNTSGGWEGIGGSAMTQSYTLIIESRRSKMAFIYYNAKLAYICKMDEDWDDFKLYPPGMSECKKKLDVIYKSK